MSCRPRQPSRSEALRPGTHGLSCRVLWYSMVRSQWQRSASLENVATLLQCGAVRADGQHLRRRKSAPACRSPPCRRSSTTRAFVSPALKARVQAAVAALRYQPNLLARSMAKQRTQTLGMIVPDIANPFFPEVVRGAEDVAHARRLHAAHRQQRQRSQEGRGLPAAVPREARRRHHPDQGARADAARAAARAREGRRSGRAARAHGPGFHQPTSSSSTTRRRLRRRHPPCCASATGASASSAACTARARAASASTATRPRCGTRRSSSIPALVVEGDFRVESGYRAGLQLLKRRPDAVFIANYLMTVGFMEALRQYRLRCPEDVALVTCDDYPWMDSFSPRLTTIDLPKRELGAAAAQLLVERIAKKRGRARTIVLKNALRVRESCGCGLRKRHGAGPMMPRDRWTSPLAVRCSRDGAQQHRPLRARDRPADHRRPAASTPMSAAARPTSASARAASACDRCCSPRSATIRSASSSPRFSTREQVETRFIPRKPGRRTSAVILTISRRTGFR